HNRLPNKRLMHRTHGILAAFEVDNHRNLDFAGGNHVDVDVVLCQRFKNFRGDPSVAAHTDTDDGEFANVLVGDHFADAEITLKRLDHFRSFEQLRFVDGERDVGRGSARAVADVLDDHIDVDRGVSEGLENAGGDAWFVRHTDERDLRLVLVE